MPPSAPSPPPLLPSCPFSPLPPPVPAWPPLPQRRELPRHSSISTGPWGPQSPHSDCKTQPFSRSLPPRPATPPHRSSSSGSQRPLSPPPPPPRHPMSLLLPRPLPCFLCCRPRAYCLPAPLGASRSRLGRQSLLEAPAWAPSPSSFQEAPFFLLLRSPPRHLPSVPCHVALPLAPQHLQWGRRERPVGASWASWEGRHPPQQPQGPSSLPSLPWPKLRRSTACAASKIQGHCTEAVCCWPSSGPFFLKLSRLGLLSDPWPSPK